MSNALPKEVQRHGVSHTTLQTGTENGERITYKYIESTSAGIFTGRVECMSAVRFAREVTEQQQTRANDEHTTDHTDHCELDKP